MIFDETYRPWFERVRGEGLHSRHTGPVAVDLVAVASRTGVRGERYLAERPALGTFSNHHGPDALAALLRGGVDAVCVATPDDRHFEPAKMALAAGKHVLIEKPSVLSLETTRRTALAG